MEGSYHRFFTKDKYFAKEFGCSHALSFIVIIITRKPLPQRCPVLRRVKNRWLTIKLQKSEPAPATTFPSDFTQILALWAVELAETPTLGYVTMPQKGAWDPEGASAGIACYDQYLPPEWLLNEEDPHSFGRSLSTPFTLIKIPKSVRIYISDSIPILSNPLNEFLMLMRYWDLRSVYNTVTFKCPKWSAESVLKTVAWEHLFSLFKIASAFFPVSFLLSCREFYFIIAQQKHIFMLKISSLCWW